MGGAGVLETAGKHQNQYRQPRDNQQGRGLQSRELNAFRTRVSLEAV